MADLKWLIVLFALLTFASSIIAIITIRATWDDISQREIGMIPLYVTVILAFITGIIATINIYTRPNLCYLPFSRQLVRMK